MSFKNTEFILLTINSEPVVLNKRFIVSVLPNGDETVLKYIFADKVQTYEIAEKFEDVVAQL